MLTQLGNVTVVVRNLSRGLKFYRDTLGLRVAFIDRKHDWICLDTGKCTLSLTVPWNRASKKLVGVPTGVSFVVHDIDAAYMKLRRRRVKFSFGPTVQPWGGVLANFRDPDGNKFFLLEFPSDFRK